MGQKKHIRIIATSDVHAHIHGLAQSDSFVRSISKLRSSSVDDYVLIDNGDYLVGSTLGTYFNSSLSEPLSRTIDPINEVGYDAMIPGNHEFDHGLCFLRDRVKHFSGHYLCANVYENGKRVFAPYTVVDKGGCRVGIIGLVTGNLAQLTPRSALGDLRVTSVLTELHELVPLVRAECDLLIVCYHGGWEKDPQSGKALQYDTGEDQGYQILINFPEIDALVLGHQHRVSSGKCNQTLYVQPGYGGTALGVIDFQITKVDGAWKCEKSENTGDIAWIYQAEEMTSEIFPVVPEFEHWWNSKVNVDFLPGYLLTHFPCDLCLLAVDDTCRKSLYSSLPKPYQVSIYCFSSEELDSLRKELLAGRFKGRILGNIHQYRSEKNRYTRVISNLDLGYDRIVTQYINNIFDEYEMLIARNKQFRIIYTADVHSFLLTTDYADASVKKYGLLSLARKWQKDENTLLIDGGDMIQGSALADYLSKQGLPLQADLQNELGYDFYTLGNHEFNYGKKYLQEYIRRNKAQLLCANVTIPGTDLLNSQIVTLADGLRIGIVGIVTDFVNVWEHSETLSDIEISDAFTAAQTELTKIRQGAGVDLAICIYHGGIENNLNTHERLSDSKENIACRLATELDFDLILTGHQHQVIAGQRYGNSYMVQPPARGIGWIDINILYEDTVKNAHITSSLQHGDLLGDLNVPEWLSEVELEVRQMLDQPIGTLAEPLVFPHTSEQGSSEDVRLADKLLVAEHGASPLGLLAEAQMSAFPADITAVSLANDARELANCELKLRDLVAFYPYSNTLVTVGITGAQFISALEHNAAYFEQNDAGAIRISGRFIYPKEEHYLYDYFFGCRYTIDVSKPVGSRISKVYIGAEPLEALKTYRLTLTDYRANGGGGFKLYRSLPRLNHGKTEVIDLIRRQLEGVKFYKPQMEFGLTLK